MDAYEFIIIPLVFITSLLRGYLKLSREVFPDVMRARVYRWMTFCPEWLIGSPALNTSNPLYLVVSSLFVFHSHPLDVDAD